MGTVWPTGRLANRAPRSFLDGAEGILQKVGNDKVSGLVSQRPHNLLTSLSIHLDLHLRSVVWQTCTGKPRDRRVCRRPLTTLEISSLKVPRDHDFNKREESAKTSMDPVPPI